LSRQKLAVQSSYGRRFGNQINITMAIIDKLQKELQRQNLATSSNKARQWIRNKVKDLSSLRPETIMRDRKRKETTFDLGAMYFFVYNPKLQNDLPFYDLFPLVIPIETYSDGFLGLNLHYLAPIPRAKLLDELSNFAQNKKFDEKTRIAASYQTLKGMSSSELFRPCVKRYLTQHVRSRFLRIEASEWDIAIFLPVESFIGASKQKVFSDSRKKYQ
jgi:hypothetical protein